MPGSVLLLTTSRRRSIEFAYDSSNPYVGKTLHVFNTIEFASCLCSVLIKWRFFCGNIVQRPEVWCVILALNNNAVPRLKQRAFRAIVISYSSLDGVRCWWHLSDPLLCDIDRCNALLMTLWHIQWCHFVYLHFDSTILRVVNHVCWRLQVGDASSLEEVYGPMNCCWCLLGIFECML